MGGAVDEVGRVDGGVMCSPICSKYLLQMSEGLCICGCFYRGCSQRSNEREQ